MAKKFTETLQSYKESLFVIYWSCERLAGILCKYVLQRLAKTAKFIVSSVGGMLIIPSAEKVT